MPDVVFNLNAEEGAAVSSFLKLVDVQNKVEQASRKMADASKSSSEAMKATAEDAEKHLESLNSKTQGAQAAFEGLKGGVEAVTAAVTAMAAAGNAALQHMEEKAQGLQTEMQTLMGALAQGGQQALLPQVEQAIGDISKTSHTMDKNQIAALFAQVHKTSKGQLSTEEELENVREAVQAGNAGFDAGAFARTRAGLQKKFLKGVSAAETSDITAEIMKVNPEGLDEGGMRFLNRAGAAGADPRRALQLWMASQRSEENSKTLNKFTQLADEEITPSEKHMEVSAASKTKIEGIKSEITGLEEQKLQGEKRGSRMTKSARKELEQRIQEKHLEIARLEEDKVERPLSAEEKSRNALAGFEKGDARFAALMAHPELAGPKMTAQVTNLLQDVHEDDFGEAGGFGKALAAQRGVVNNNVRYKRLERINDLAIKQRNIKASPSEVDLAGAGEAAELETAVRENGGATEIIYDLGGKQLNRGLIGVKGAIGQDAFRGDGGQFGPGKASSAATQNVRIVNDGNKPMVRGGGNAGVE